MTDPPSDPLISYPIVGVGSSSGGLKALTALLESLPAEPGICLLLISHHSPRLPNLLPRLLASHCRLPISEATHLTRVRINHVFLMPAGCQLTLHAGVLQLAHGTPSTEPYLPIDSCFLSLAEELGSRAIGVVLSGDASDGTRGSRAIHAAGGVVFVQAPNTARHTAMPQSVIAAGCADRVLPPEHIGVALAHIDGHPGSRLPQPPLPAPQVRRILAALQSHAGHDFSKYKPRLIARRIARRLQVLGLDSAEDYLQRLRTHTAEPDRLFDELLINLSGFFRDPKVYALLLEQVFPSLRNAYRRRQRLRIWVPGCAQGQEAYSLAIGLHDFLRGDTDGLQLFATDISPTVIQVARRGLYTRKDLSGLSEDLIARHFHQLPEGLQIKRHIRNLCTFAVHNLTRDPPFSRVDLISCRNVLIYLNPLGQTRVLGAFYRALQADGFLLLGQSETVRKQGGLFRTVNDTLKLYGKNTPRPRMDPSAQRLPMPANHEGVIPMRQGQQDLIVQSAKDLLLERYAPVGALIDATGDVLHCFGRTWPYLETPPGTASLNLYSLLHPDLEVDVRAAIRAANVQQRAASCAGLQIGSGDDRRALNLQVIPLARPTEEGAVLVLFETLDDRVLDSTTTESKTAALATNAHMQREILSLRDYSQSIVEELESTNEELRAANEEVQSSNEELQATNQELEEAKRDLLKINQELVQVNRELETRNQALQTSNSDLANLLANVTQPVLILDLDLKVRQYTRSAGRLLGLSAEVLGARIDTLPLPVELPDLSPLLPQVIEDMTPIDCTVTHRDGRTLRLQLRPYKTLEHRIDGVLLSVEERPEAKG